MERRAFLQMIGAASLAAFVPMAKATAGAGVKIGICDWNLGPSCDPELIPRAAEEGLSGIQVSVGTRPDHMPLRDPRVRRRYLELGQRYGIAVHSVAAGGILNAIPLAEEPQSAVYVIDALEAAAALGAKNILIAFFGNGDLRLTDASGKFIEKKRDGWSVYELDTKKVTRVVEALRQIAPRAEDLGVALGLENTLNAEQNLEIIDRIGSPMAQVYYD
ncbi:MAG: sugar phosphate isomerase/epimerase, partial [candidate division KSB1 bacterium]|nr:sugar phosphate isomerase/epimerase [candidate division KSB1 bacterium]